MNEIIVHSQAGAVSFPNYQEVLNQAIELAEHISQLEVTEENVKTTKNMLATVNKRVTELEDQRKAVKKQLLEPYEAFEKQVKAIVGVVKEADTMVRQQVKQLEEQERDSKYNELVHLFYRRLELYPTLNEIFNVDHFIEPKHLNKTTSINKVEEEMVQWFEHQKQSVALIRDLEDTDEIMVEYLTHLDPVKAIQTVKDRKQMKANLTQNKTAAKMVTIEFPEEYLSQVHVFMKLSNIPYNKK